MAMTSIEQLLAPLGWDRFAAEHWRRRPVHIAGTADKAAGLASWPDLNAVLETQRLDAGRLLVGYHQPADVVRTERNRRGHDVPALDVPALYRELRDGKSLVVFGIDEILAPVRQLADGIGWHFGAHVEINLFAAFGHSASFGTHRDDQDHFIVQVAGKKRWQLFGESADAVAPTTVVDDVVLAAGDVLYVPRGHWHDVTAVGEPSLHLTCKLASATGADLLGWLTSELCAADARLRMDLPRFAGVDERRAHVARLRDAIRAGWTGDLLARYFARVAADIGARPRVNLPDAAIGDGLPDGDDFVVASNLRALPEPIIDGDEVAFTAAGREWRLDAAFAPLVRTLLCDGPRRLRELAGAHPAVTADDARAFVADLFAEGLVFVVP